MVLAIGPQILVQGQLRPLWPKQLTLKLVVIKMNNTKKMGQSPKYMKRVLGVLLPYLEPHKLVLTVVILMLLLNGALTIGFGFAANYVVDNLPDERATAIEFIDSALKYALIFIFSAAVVRYTHSYLLVKVAAKVTEAIRTKVFANINSQSQGYFDGQHSGDLQTRIVADINMVGQFISAQIPVNLSSLVRLIGGLVGAIFVSSKLTLAVIIGLPLLFLPFFVVAKPLRLAGKNVQSATSEVGQFAGESFRNVKLIKAYNHEERQNNRFANYAADVVRFTLNKARLEQGVGAAINGFAMLGAAFLLWFCAKNIYQGVMTVGELVSFSYFVYLMVVSVSKVINFVSSLNGIMGSAEKVVDYLELETNTWHNSETPIKVTGSINFKDIYFSYPKRPKMQVLNGVNLDIDVGSHIAVVGSSGAGKSTLFELLLRFYPMKQGQILINGIDISELSMVQLRNCIGFVPQKESLVSGTILENIRFGTEGTSRENVVNIVGRLGLHEFIESLPNGYDTDLGEVGSRLSGGQKQRIALARALIGKPQILLLDEANSALDKETDRFISKFIHSWSKQNNVTVITIAHRLETAANADEIVVMDEGQVIGKGTHEQLILSCQLYKKLVQGSELEEGENRKAEQQVLAATI